MQKYLWVAALTTLFIALWGEEVIGNTYFIYTHQYGWSITARMSSYLCTGYCRYSIVFFRKQPRLLHVCDIVRHCFSQHAGEDESCKISTHPLFSKCAVVGYMLCLCWKPATQSSFFLALSPLPQKIQAIFFFDHLGVIHRRVIAFCVSLNNRGYQQGGQGERDKKKWRKTSNGSGAVGCCCIHTLHIFHVVLSAHAALNRKWHTATPNPKATSVCWVQKGLLAVKG